ncbi:hypothetical protein STRAU_3655 [Streptomyces aurantiacus JA 4570]|uniref:Uncharacterized protein n=1 Tax=Streptomyces aurantiacus JA 4570 TaxID=1286094 RepID=S3ZKG1_9ACTN|nr:hypothetical protein STRAU_3655 [Streptomyces aurantiacus JA 4570]
MQVRERRLRHGWGLQREHWATGCGQSGGTAWKSSPAH